MKKFYSVLVFVVACSAIAFAGDKPLALKGSTPAAGAVDVVSTQAIVIEFSNNVVNRKDQKNNSGCFHLVSESGEEVAVDVNFPDDQMEPELKRTITVVPKEALVGGGTYTLIIDAKLKSKNGRVMGHQESLSFSVAE